MQTQTGTFCRSRHQKGRGAVFKEKMHATPRGYHFLHVGRNIWRCRHT